MRTKEISGTCVDTKPRGIEATCIVSGDRRRSCIILYNKQQNFDGVCKCLRMIELTQELTAKTTLTMRRLQEEKREVIVHATDTNGT